MVAVPQEKQYFTAKMSPVTSRGIFVSGRGASVFAADLEQLAAHASVVRVAALG